MSRLLPGLRVGVGPYGFDDFGLNAQWVRRTYRALSPLYDYWFRVSSYGAPVLDDVRGAIVAANHSGTLPFDGMMLWMDIVRQTTPTRVPRFALDTFVPSLPYVSLWFARCGAFSGTRGNVHRLLERGELLMIFPEGTPGISKPWSKRYELQSWRVGHAEMAIRHRVPVVPVAIVGAEEQMPQLGRLRSLRPLGVPFLPIPATPIPLPVHYHIHYGAPIRLHERFTVAQAEDPGALREAASEVSDTVERLLRRGLAAREGVFA